MALNEGAEAPDFSLSNQDDKATSLGDFSGKWLILYFYPKDNTPGCTTEAIDFTGLKDQFDSLGATVVGVSPDSPKSHRNFIAKKELNLTLLSDPEKEVCKSYEAWALKKMYGKEYWGVLRSTFLISPNGIVEEVWSKVKVKGHADEVLNKLKGKV